MNIYRSRPVPKVLFYICLNLAHVVGLALSSQHDLAPTQLTFTTKNNMENFILRIYWSWVTSGSVQKTAKQD